ncbi:MAG: radical SAM protein [Candidatus Adiutrix sp.]|jgi:radical SAM protein with 4Fe4S-binding SPASM domain|nr:radical SAM protein [Candidatus Adiutrix sp.]
MKPATANAATIAPPRLVAWEATRACNLLCRHCRAEAVLTPPPGELNHEEGRDFLEQMAAWPPSPMVILSGGEPLMRPDILDLAAYGHFLGLRMLLSTNGTLVDAAKARAMKDAGIARVSLSLDRLTPADHDQFRGQPGAFEALERGAAHLREAALPFQINSTLTAENLHQAPALTDLAASLGAVAHHIFLLVPVGRAEGLEAPLSADQYEAALRTLKEREASLPVEFKATCAPQYQRLGKQMGLAPQGRHGSGRGCLAGQGFAFMSAEGEVRGCGYLPNPAGQLSRQPGSASQTTNLGGQSFREIYENSPLFRALRDKSCYHGKCGVCEYWNICGGCRARARAEGDHMGPEPLCPYQPKNEARP